ncbi:hypothetical protein [Vibrio mediterranei]|uniref:hypothetical protein n=1 Tax=Vibrio mediterranei TaxID=689 RepID=UPI0040683F5F
MSSFVGSIPFFEQQRRLIEHGEVLNEFAVPKFNSYRPDEEHTLEEAVECLFYQSRFASSHQLLDSNNNPLEIELTIEESVKLSAGTCLVVRVKHNEIINKLTFIVNDSESHYFFFDLSTAMAVAQSRYIS